MQRVTPRSAGRCRAATEGAGLEELSAKLTEGLMRLDGRPSYSAHGTIPHRFAEPPLHKGAIHTLSHKLNRAGPFGVGVCPAVFLMDGSLRRVQRTHGFLGVFHQVQQACRVAGVVLGQALGA